MDFQWYTTISGIILATGVGVQAIKRFLGNRAPFASVPTWVYSVLLAAVLTALSKYFGYLTTAGTWLEVLMQSVMTAGATSGFVSWLQHLDTPIEESEPAKNAAAAARRAALLFLVVSLAFGVAACGKRYVPGTTPQQAIAYELNEGLKPLVDTQAIVIAAVDAVCLPKEQPKDPARCAALKPNADKFLNPVYELLQFVKKEVSPRLEQFDAAMKTIDTVRQGELRAELVPLIEKVGVLSAQAFGTALPDGLVAKVTTLAGKTITTFKELRDAITDVIRSVREDVTGATPTPATAN